MTLTKTLIPLCFVMMFISCNQSNSQSNDPDTEWTPENTIPKSQFLIWKKNWRKHAAGYMDTTRLTFFGVPDIDLIELIGSDPDSTRFYIGLDSLGPNHFYPHIMLLGVKNGVENRNLILDYSTTCPPQCPPTF